jgi:phosphate starvation-inducible PhoH-like protein
MAKKKNLKIDVTDEYFPSGIAVRPSFTIKEFEWTQKQKVFIKALLNYKNKIVFCKAPAGVGKTLCATYAALKLVKEGHADRILYIRNPVESAKSIGFLPGDLSEKMTWVLQPLMDQLRQLIPYEFNIKQLIKDGVIQGCPLGYIKGTSNIRTIMIVDETADLTVQDLLLCLTRIGKDSKIFLVGDVAQCHIKNSGFSQVFRLFNDEESKDNGIATFQFGVEDIMRNEILKYVIGKFESFEKPV